jgi:hypothetical protein
MVEGQYEIPELGGPKLRQPSKRQSSLIIKSKRRSLKPKPPRDIIKEGGSDGPDG